MRDLSVPYDPTNVPDQAEAVDIPAPLPEEIQPLEDPRTTGNNSDDHTALVELYNSAGGVDWFQQYYWLNNSLPVCRWGQVTCDDSGRINNLQFTMNKLKGTIPESFGLLAHLETLQLVFNPELTGALPSSIVNTSLTYLYAWDTGLSSLPNEIGQMKTLVTLDMSNSNLKELPASITKLTGVTTAYFDGNHLNCSSLPKGFNTWLTKVKYHTEMCHGHWNDDDDQLAEDNDTYGEGWY